MIDTKELPVGFVVSAAGQYKHKYVFIKTNRTGDCWAALHTFEHSLEDIAGFDAFRNPHSYVPEVYQESDYSESELLCIRFGFREYERLTGIPVIFDIQHSIIKRRLILKVL